MIETNELMEMAESLPIDLKTRLIDRLLKSISPSPQEIDELWAKEIERRVEELAGGTVATIPGKDVFRKINGRLK